jgi:hypothetical protein
MLRHLSLDLSQLTVRPDPKLGTVVRPGPRRRKNSVERAAMLAAMEVAKPFRPRLGGPLEVLEFSLHPPTISVVTSPTVAIAASASPDLTLALGWMGSAGWIAEVAAEGGVYGSTTLEFGVFDTLGFVLGLATGVSVGVEYTLVFGPPSDFAGLFIAFQASIGPKELGGLAIGGSLLFAVGPPTAAGPSLTFKGLTLNGTFGWSALPVSLSVEWSNTRLKPLIK